MINILITFLTFVLIIIGIFMVLVILMQRANSDGGMGSAFGGGAAESAFGADTTNILTRITKWAAIAFFILSFVLYLLWMKQSVLAKSQGEADLPEIAIESSETTLPEESITETIPETTDEVISETPEEDDSADVAAETPTEESTTETVSETTDEVISETAEDSTETSAE